MNYINGFAKDEFLQYMFEEFPTVFNTSFSREMLENLVDYGVENHSVSKNSLYYFLKDMIPETEYRDLIPYIDEKLLTNEVLCLVGQNEDFVEKKEPYLVLVEKMDEEMEKFKVSYKNFDFRQVYNDWYTIGFYESYYDMLSCDFLENQNVEEEILWLSGKEKLLEFLYNKWMDCDGAFSHNWDDMLDFIRTTYEKELQRESLNKESPEKEPENYHIGEFDISALMNTLANNAWYGREPTQMYLAAGDDIIMLEGYTYEPGYEDFSSTASVSLNGEVLYGVDSRNVDAYKNEVYNIGRYNTLEEAVSHIKEQIKGKEPILFSEPKKLDEKINSVIDKSKQSKAHDGYTKDDIVLE